MTTGTAKNTTKNLQKSRKSSGFGLDSIGDLSALLMQPETAKSGGPLMLDMALIDEDPNQPRTEDNPGFSAESLGELATTIRLRGVKTPISVRDNPNVEGRYIINHGARRFRGSKLAGKTHIPAFVDNDYLEADQVIENLQRNELTAREIADYIGRELAKGKKKGVISKELGKSPAFVTQHVTLLDLPEPIAEAFNSGRVRDVTVVNELVMAHKKKPTEVAVWLAEEEQEITRGNVKLLREFLEDMAHDPNEVDTFDGKADVKSGEDGEEGFNAKEKGSKELNKMDSDKLKKAIVQVRHDDRPARLILTKRPPSEGFAWLKYDDNGQEFKANLQDVRLVALVEG